MADEHADGHNRGAASSWAKGAVATPAFLALADQAIISASNFLTNIIVGRSVADSDFGAYFLALSLLYMVKGAQETLVSAPFVVFRQRKGVDELARYRGSSAAYQVFTTLAILLVLPLLALLLAWCQASATLVRASLIMLAAAPFLMLREYLRRVSFAEFRFGLALGMDVTITVTQLTLLAALWHFGQLSSLVAFIAMGTACLIGGVVWLLRRPVDFRLDQRQMLADWRADFVFGRWALMTFVLGCSTPYIMPWLLGLSRGDAAVARFGAAQTLVGLANMFVLGVNNLLGPQAARSFALGGAAKLLATLSKTSMIFVTVLGAFCALLWLLGDQLAGLAFDGKYLALRNTMVFLAAAMLFGSLKMTGGSGLSAMHLPKMNLPADATMLLVSLAAGIPLTIRFAETGTAAGVAVGAVAACAVRWCTLFACLGQSETGASLKGANDASADAELIIDSVEVSQT